MNRTPSKPREIKPHTTLIGSKFEATRNLDIADVAKLVRVDIKQAVASNELPRGRYSVRTSRYSMGQSIAIEISDVAEPFVLFNPLREAFDLANPYASHCDLPPEVLSLYSEQATALRAKIEAVLAQYNRVISSNEHDDYSNTHFHCEVSFASGLWRDAKRVSQDQINAAALATSPTEPAPALSANDTTSAQEQYLASIGAL